MNEMTACGREEWPAITMIIFRNYQWGAEKRNTTLWYDDNFVGTELDVLLNQELGEPFRRDAMKKPVVVAGINRDDMRPQQGAV
jgi:sulfoacetaldehyde acetyltransferase